MIPYVLNLSDVRATLETAGGKGMSLSKMLNAGLPVPGGFQITTEAYTRFVADNGLQPRILSSLAACDPGNMESLEKASGEIGVWFSEGKLPGEIRSAVAVVYAELSGKTGEPLSVAVRSSATAEDLPDASFAGQQETYLNIRGEEAVLLAVRRCWASLWTARAIAYRMKNGIDQASVALAVVVQELVDAASAGIMFTANPVNGKRNELLINAAWGLGEAVVSGAVTPDTLTVEKATGRVLKKAIAEKAVMTVRLDGGTHEVPVPEAARRKPVLSRGRTAELARLGRRIEEFYGMPMDVEWAFVAGRPGSGTGGRFAILQARPITAIPPEWTVPDPAAVYARGSLAEHTPSPVTPLFATLGLELANEATAALWERMLGRHAKTIMAGDGFYLPLNGYVYGGVRMRGRAFWAVLRMSFAQIGPMFRGSVARWQEARKEFASVVDAWERKDPGSLSPEALLEGIRTVFGAACRYFTAIQTTLPAASSSEVLFGKLYGSLIRRKTDPEATVFLLGSETTAIRMEKSLFDISRHVRDTPGLTEYLLAEPTDRIVEAVRGGGTPAGIPAERWKAFAARFTDHLKDFGRTAYEFDFVHPTPMETPAPQIDTLKAYLEGRAGDPYERQGEAVRKREEAAGAVLSRIGWPRRGWFVKLLRWAQETGPMREDSIFDMGMGHPLVRRLFAELGTRLADRGALPAADDIFWLEKAELEALVSALSAGNAPADFTDRIPARKEEWKARRALVPPVMLPEKSGWSRFIHGSAAELKDGHLVLHGVGTSGGTVTAPACVLSGPEDFGTMKTGDILVAVTTTPAWTPLFAMASAVVTDIGGPLSHSSIVAREYGIPAVMAAREATRTIRSGMLVRVNGTEGTVTLLG